MEAYLEGMLSCYHWRTVRSEVDGLAILGDGSVDRAFSSHQYLANHYSS